MKKIILALIALISIMSLNAQTITDETYRVIFSQTVEDINKDIITQTKSIGCSNTSEGTIGLVDCDDIGTAAFTAASLTDNFDASGSVNVPSTTPGTAPCATITTNGQSDGVWHVYDLATGVDQVAIDYVDGSFAGSTDIEMAFYQGTDCNNLTTAGCDQIIDRNGSNLILQEVGLSGLNDAQQLWIFTYSTKTWDMDLTLTGTGTPPVNDNCATATSSATGCNLGATGAAFTPPGPTLCPGGNWGSNENTVFYTFTATATTGSINIDNMICNDGTAGVAQVGVWTNCAAVAAGDYTAGNGFLGCTVGTGSITLPTLVVNNSYIIAVDGFAGDACTWDFVTTGIVLHVELSHLRGYSHERGYNVIEWTTSTEVDNSHFLIERSNDGSNWKNIAKLNGLGNSINFNDYNYKDYERKSEINYYRLIQVDYDGKTEEIDILKIDNSSEIQDILKITNIMGQDVDESYRGFKNNYV